MVPAPMPPIGAPEMFIFSLIMYRLYNNYITQKIIAGINKSLGIPMLDTYIPMSLTI
jgi:hypothetical protein